VAFAGVVDWEACGAECREEELDWGDDGSGLGDVVALVGEVTALFADLEASGVHFYEMHS